VRVCVCVCDVDEKGRDDEGDVRSLNWTCALKTVKCAA